jgi:hypothetical protein
MDTRSLGSWAKAIEGAVFRRLRPRGRVQDTVGEVRLYAVHGTLGYEGPKFILRVRFASASLASTLSLIQACATYASRWPCAAGRACRWCSHTSPQTTLRYAHDMDSLDNNTVDDVNWRGHLGVIGLERYRTRRHVPNTGRSVHIIAFRSHRWPSRRRRACSQDRNREKRGDSRWGTYILGCSVCKTDRG